MKNKKKIKILREVFLEYHTFHSLNLEEYARIIGLRFMEYYNQPSKITLKNLKNWRDYV